MGVFEFPKFSAGTKAVAEAMIAATKNNDSFTVVGGGDSAASVRTLGPVSYTHLTLPTILLV